MDEARSRQSEDCDEKFALREDRTAYRRSMPALSGIRNIRNFIVCLTMVLPSAPSTVTCFRATLCGAPRAFLMPHPALKSGKIEKPRLKAIKGGKSAAPVPFSAPAQPGLTASLAKD